MTTTSQHGHQPDLRSACAECYRQGEAVREAQRQRQTTTLASEVVVNFLNGSSRRRDVVLTVHEGRRTVIDIDMRHHTTVTLSLTGAERISLIELLGGRDAR